MPFTDSSSTTGASVPGPDAAAGNVHARQQHQQADGQQDQPQGSHADGIIVGAGIAGCALAVALGKQGRRVILLERSLREPDRIVGELLQPGGVRALHDLGISDCLDGIDAVPVLGYNVIYNADPVHIPYPPMPWDRRRRLAEGRSFHHGRFVQRLRDAARRTPGVTVVEATVVDLVRDGAGGGGGRVVGVECKAHGGDREFYFAPLTFVADGYASNFRKALHPHDPARVVPTVRSRFHGLELHDAPLPRPQHGHVLLGAAHPPILLYQISARSTRILVDVPEGLASASAERGGVANHLRAVVLPALPESPPALRAALAAALDAGARPRAMPNSWLPARGPTRRVSPDGVAVVGDALNMRHPLTGGGMTCALRDALALARTLEPKRVGLHFDKEAAVRQGLRDFHWRRKSGAAVINILAQALYSLFAADDANLRALQLGCFRYFQLGGDCVDGPVGLLAGLIRSPLVLLYHFFAVALYAIWIEARRYPLPLVPVMLVWRGASILWTACVVIFPYVGAELRN